jgi:radical SAM protein with 4Fe4S-binding SPASM domain
MLYPALGSLVAGLAKHFGKSLLISCITNGLAPDTCINFARSASRAATLQLFVSMDGIDEATNTAVRGIQGGLGVALNTLHTLIEINRSEKLGIRLGVSFTIVKQNLTQIEYVYQFACTHGIDFICRVAGLYAAFYGINRDYGFLLGPDDLQYADKVLKSIAAGNSSMGSSQRWFLSNTYRGIHGDTDLNCYAASRSVCIRTNGDVTACLFSPRVLGNIADTDLDAILDSKDTQHFRHSVRAKECHCWNDCESISNYEYTQFGISPKAGW